MASTAATPPVVTGAGVRETIDLGGRRYVLAAPTYAAVGEFLEAQARLGTPGAAELADAIRAAMEASGEGIEALDAAEEAEDAWISFVNVHQVTGPDATENIQTQAVELNRTLLKARRARDRATAKVMRDPRVLELRAQQQAATHQEHCGLCALLLREWEGEGLPPFPEKLDGAAVAAALPMGDVAVLAKRAYALMQPTADAAKN
jgi:hypothetical protein